MQRRRAPLWVPELPHAAAKVGLPPGAGVDRISLAKLLDDWTISRYELQPDRIVFYLWP
ncbi:MAG TPA: hypothetical protein VKB47_08035 [Terracidiphilus sp.]|nr:hypothetical protein [Terracidiphilus sp.]